VIFHTDCRHYRASAPCAPHKRSGVRCPECRDYAAAGVRILIVKLDALGDVLRTTAILDPIRRLHPRCHITWITRAAAAPLLAGNPHVDRLLTLESGYLEFLHVEDFDLAFGPDADPLSAAILSLARAAEKRGFVSDRRGGVVPLNAAAESWWQMGLDDVAKKQNRRTYGEWLYDICELPTPVARPIFALPRSARGAAERLFDDAAPQAPARACFNTGASGRWQEKSWKSRHYSELGRQVRARWPGTAIALVGGSRERQLNTDLLASGAGFIEAGTSHSIDAFAGLVAASSWLLTTDSLGYHLACALGTPAVCLVGPTSPWELDCYGTNRVVHADLPCIACYLGTCPLPTTCMDALTPAQVLPAIEAVVAASPQCAAPAGVQIKDAANLGPERSSWLDR
jgi:ADP-heptose:LPS heptosyltransferase